MQVFRVVRKYPYLQAEQVLKAVLEHCEQPKKQDKQPVALGTPPTKPTGLHAEQVAKLFTELVQVVQAVLHGSQ